MARIVVVGVLAAACLMFAASTVFAYELGARSTYLASHRAGMELGLATCRMMIVPDPSTTPTPRPGA